MADDYAHPEVLVSTDWVAQHRDDSNVRIVESDEDVLLYETGHIPGSVKVDWMTQLQHQVVRDYIDTAAFEQLCRERGIANDTTVVFYGDKSNWWACYAFWTFKMFGHRDCRIMNGGRQLWIAEGRELTTEVPSYPATNYQVEANNEPKIRAFRDDVVTHLSAGKPLVDVRSEKEYTGELLHMEDYPQEGALRGGHITGAVSCPWNRAVQGDGRFKPADQLRRIYQEELGLKTDDEIIAYCRIGERSSLTWFVLTYLLGYPIVRNYDGSWTEWGNLVRVPVTTGPQPA